MNILTLDIEDVYNSLAKDKIKSIDYSFVPQLNKLLALLEKNNVKPTLFVVAEFALRNKKLIYNLAQKYDIGSHGFSHDLVSTQTYNGFKEDIVRSIDVLEDITGKKITKYRTPGFSIPNYDYLKVLFDTPIEADASLSARNHFYGPQMIKKSEPCIIEYTGKRIKEFPPTVLRFLGMDCGFLGGGYFRLFPHFIIKNHLNKNKNYSLLYLHPSDFDKNQPKLHAYSLFAYFRRYVGLTKAENKLTKLLNGFSFCDIDSADNKINWADVPIIKF